MNTPISQPFTFEGLLCLGVIALIARAILSPLLAAWWWHAESGYRPLRPLSRPDGGSTVDSLSPDPSPPCEMKLSFDRPNIADDDLAGETPTALPALCLHA